MKKRVMYLFKLTDDKLAVKDKGNLTFPADYFDIDSFSKTYSVNPWNNSMVMKISRRKVYMFDFRIFQKPSAYYLNHLKNNTNLDATQSLRILKGGSMLALIGKNFVDLQSLVNYKRTKVLYFKNNINDTTYLNDGNTLVILLNQTFEYLKCDLNHENFTTAHAILPRLKELTKKNETKRLKLTRTGTHFIGVLTSSLITYINSKEDRLDDLKFSASKMCQDCEIFKSFQLSNIIQIKKVDPVENQLHFKFFKLKSDDKKYLHPTCTYKLLFYLTKYPFTPCPMKLMLGWSLILSTVLVLSLIGVLHCLGRVLEFKKKKES